MTPRRRLQLLWIGALLLYALVLINTSHSGPHWAFWLWSIIALPAFIASFAQPRLTALGVTLGVTWLLFAVGIRWALDLEAVWFPLATILITWPLVLAMLAVWRLQRRDTGHSSSHAPPAA